jgi:hypothetical protein
MRYIFTIIVFLLSLEWTIGQDVSIDADYPRVVSEGEQFAITWTINSQAENFTAPQFTGFYKLMGPQTGYSSSTVFNNGKFSKQIQSSFTYYLQALKSGKYSLAPATVKIKNRIYSSDSIRIEVVQGNQAPTAQGGSGIEPDDNEAGRIAAKSSDMFLRVIPSSTEIYAGEPFSVTAKFYTRIQITDLSEIKLPAFNSFIREDVQIPPLTSLKRESLNGIIYGTGVKSQMILVPQIAGNLTIEPFEITAMVQQRTGQSDPFFGDFFSSYTNVPQVVISDPVTIKVKPLPSPRPADFSGIVGNIKMTASLSRDSVSVNDALNYKIVISGSGNLKLASPPKIVVSNAVEVFDPKITDNLSQSASGLTGQKVFEYVIIPREPGKYLIPPVTYTYFNPATAKYETLNAAERSFLAYGSFEGTVTPLFSGSTATDVKYFGKDIRYIVTEPEGFKESSPTLISENYFLFLFALFFSLFIILITIRREQLRRNSDLIALRNRKAGKVATLRLREAEKCLKSGVSDRFHEEILKALWGYLSDKLAIPPAGLNKESASAELRRRGVDETQIDSLIDLLAKCEFARFAPSGSLSENDNIYRDASEFIKKLENTRGKTDVA